MDRHERQMRLAEVGVAGQQRISRASAEVTLGGFAGEIAARYLSGAGVRALWVRDAGSCDAARRVDPAVCVQIATAAEAEVAPPPTAAHGAKAALAESATDGCFCLGDPVARDLAAGAHLALRRLREMLGMGP